MSLIYINKTKTS